MRYPLVAATVSSLVIAVGAAAPCAGQTVRLWNVPTGNWNVGANWDGATVPAPLETASIENGGTSTINSAVPTVASVWVGNNLGVGNLQINTGASLTVDSQDTFQNGLLVVGRTVAFVGANTGSALTMTGGALVADQIEVGQSFGGFDSSASMTVGGAATVTIHNYLRVGHGDGGSDGGTGVFTVKDNAVFTHDGAGTRPFIDDFIAFGFNGSNGGNTGTLNLQNNAVFNSKRPVRFGWVEEGKGFLNVSGNAQLNIDSGELSAAAIMFGDFHNGSNVGPNNRPIGIATQSGGTVAVGTSAARPRWGAIGGSGRGEYTLSGGKLNFWIRDGINIGDTDQNDHPGEGLLTVTGGTLNATEVWVGKIGRSTGSVVQSGGVVNIGVSTPDGDFTDRIDTLGEQTALGINDGRLNIGGAGDGSTASGTYALSGGTLRVLGANIGDRGTGAFTQSGGTFIADQGVIVARSNNGVGGAGGVPSTGTLNLNGGVLQTLSLTGGVGNTSTVNFNGGIVRATAASPTFIADLANATIGAGGAVIDSNGFAVGSAQVFLGTGGLTKLGGGTLSLSGASAYAGDTRVSGGVLSISNPFLANSADVIVLGGSTLNLTFAGVDVVDALVLGSQIAAPGVWGATGSGAQFESPLLTGSGRLQVSSTTTFPPGDFDKNGRVNAADLVQWRGDFGIDGQSDADGDGDSDGNDFLIWQRNLGLGGLAVAAGAAVPEPTGGALAGFVAAALATAGTRRRTGATSPQLGS